MSSKKLWVRSFGTYGSTVRVMERTRGGNLYVVWVDRHGRQQKRSLGHSDRQKAQQQGTQLSKMLLHDREAVEVERPTLEQTINLYLKEGLHGRSGRHRSEIERKLSRWVTFLGPQRIVDTLSPADVSRFEAARLAVARDAGKSLTATTIWHDLVSLQTALNFATNYRNQQGRRFLSANPLLGVKRPKTRNPAQPVTDYSTYQKLRAVAPNLPPLFGVALDLAYETGHRIDAILKLRWDDITLTQTETAPYGTIYWRAENDKIRNAHRVAMSSTAREAILSALRIREDEDAEWIFPAPSKAEHPMRRHLASRWFRRAEILAGIEHVKGAGWHSLRRGWASARKALPDVNVAAAGGWKDVATMKRSYQKADEEGVLEAVLANGYGGRR